MLGHDVFFIEPVAPAAIAQDNTPLAASTNARYFERVIRRFDLQGRAALLRAGTRETVGPSYDSLIDAAANADLLINISGLLSDPRLFLPIDRRVYLDLDPVFNQLWHAVEGLDVRLDGHTHYVTIGMAIGTSGCEIPTCDRVWIRTLQPIVLSEWPVTAADFSAPWTTVGNWRGYGSIEHGGVHYGQKAHSLRQFIALPRRTQETFLLALAIHPDEVRDLAALAANGWALADPAQVAGTPDDYRTFIQRSKAEFGVAKSGYVVSRCGWFSDRSVCYLASGRPVLAQDSGLAGILPTDFGLRTFSSEDDAAAGIEAIAGDYRRHASAARAIAEEFFASDRVLKHLIAQVAA
jgi:hypothetical protein